MIDTISVSVRFRPLSPSQISQHNKAIRQKQTQLKTKIPYSIWQIHPDFPNVVSNTRTNQQFVYDYIFTQQSTTSQIFNTIGLPLIQSALGGINVAIFAYGQTNSGKTYTMQGTPSDLGLTPLTIKSLFQHIQTTLQGSYLLQASYLQIYNQRVNDLLDPSKQNLNIKQSLDKGIHVDQLTQKTVSNSFEAIDLLNRGQTYRKKGQTNQNAMSSRSHTIFRITVESQQRCQIVKSQINLVDLAGSEGVQSQRVQRQREGSNINRSLLSLSNVIESLSEASAKGHKPYINYRNSKMTRLLQVALSGESKTCLICNATTSYLHYQETISTLQFGTKAKRIKCQAKINKVPKYTSDLLFAQEQIKKLQQEIGILQEEVFSKDCKLEEMKVQYDQANLELKSQFEQEKTQIEWKLRQIQEKEATLSRQIVKFDCGSPYVKMESPEQIKENVNSSLKQSKFRAILNSDQHSSSEYIHALQSLILQKDNEIHSMKVQIQEIREDFEAKFSSLVMQTELINDAASYSSFDKEKIIFEKESALEQVKELLEKLEFTQESFKREIQQLKEENLKLSNQISQFSKRGDEFVFEQKQIQIYELVKEKLILSEKIDFFRNKSRQFEQKYNEIGVELIQERNLNRQQQAEIERMKILANQLQYEKARSNQLENYLNSAMEFANSKEANQKEMENIIKKNQESFYKKTQQYQATIQELKKQLEQNQIKENQFQYNYKQIQQQISILQTRMIQQSNQNQQMKELLKQSEQSIKNTEQYLLQQKEISMRKEQQIQILNNTQSQLNKKIVQQQSHIQELQIQLNSLKIVLQNQPHQNQQQTLLQETLFLNSQLEQKVNQLNQNLLYIAEQLKRNQLTIKNQEQTINQLQQQLFKKQTQIQNLQAFIKQTKQKTKETPPISTNQHQRDYQNLFQKLQQQLDLASNQNSLLQSQISQLTEKIQKYKESFQYYKTGISQLQKENDDLLQRLQTLQTSKPSSQQISEYLFQLKQNHPQTLLELLQNFKQSNLDSSINQQKSFAEPKLYSSKQYQKLIQNFQQKTHLLITQHQQKLKQASSQYKQIQQQHLKLKEQYSNLQRQYKHKRARNQLVDQSLLKGLESSERYLMSEQITVQHIQLLQVKNQVQILQNKLQQSLRAIQSLKSQKQDLSNRLEHEQISKQHLQERLRDMNTQVSQMQYKLRCLSVTKKEDPQRDRRLKARRRLLRESAEPDCQTQQLTIK